MHKSCKKLKKRINMKKTLILKGKKLINRRAKSRGMKKKKKAP